MKNMSSQECGPLNSFYNDAMAWEAFISRILKRLLFRNPWDLGSINSHKVFHELYDKVKPIDKDRLRLLRTVYIEFRI